MFREIGSVRNEADETSQILALFRDSISEIFLNESESISAYFKPEYSHYLVVHTPLNYKGPENRTEWNLRFCRDVGVSVVELFTVEAGIAYVKGLMAVNGSKIYAILPFTSIDIEKAEKAKFPEDQDLPRAGKSASCCASRNKRGNDSGYRQWVWNANS